MNKIIAPLILFSCCCLCNNTAAKSNDPGAKHSPASKSSRNQNQSIWMDAYDGDTWHPRDITTAALHIYEKALNAYNRRIKSHPDDAGAFYGRGRVQMHLKKYKEAVDDFDMAIKFNPSFYRAYCNRGFAKFKLGDPDGALKDCNQAITVHACDTTYRSLGVLRTWMRQFRWATAAFTKAIELNGAYVDAYVRRARVEGQMHNYWAAYNDFAKAIELDPNYAESYIERANIKEDNGDYLSAISDCNKAIEIDPANAQAYLNRGWEKELLQQHDSAIADFNEALRLAPDFALAYSCRCVSKEFKGNLEGALQDCSKSVIIDTTLYYGYQNRVNVERKIGDLKSAGEDYKMAVKLFPNDSFYNLNGDSAFHGNTRFDTVSYDLYLSAWEQPKNVTEIKTDWELENLKGKVKVVRQMASKDTTEQNVMFNLNQLYNYDEYGYLTRMEEYNDSITLVPLDDSTTIKLNGRGQKTEHTAYHRKNGIAVHRFMYVYDAQGKLKERTEYELRYGNRRLICFNERGDEIRGEDVIHDTSVQMRWVVIYYYNDKGAKTRVVRVQTNATETDSLVWNYNYERDGIVSEEEIDYYPDGIRKPYITKYDSLHRAVECLIYGGNGYADMVSTTKYDTYGNKIEEGGWLAGQETASKTSMVYEYDSKGNWIKESLYNNGKLYRVITRVIEYYE